MADQVSVRYMVDDVEAAIGFYRDQLGFTVDMHPAPGFARLSRGSLRLLLNRPGGGGGAGQAMADGAVPEPGGWKRFQLEFDDVEAVVALLKGAGATLRNDVVQGVGGKQALVQDPSGNLVELFQAT